MPVVAVVGSANLDIVATAAARPGAGETLLASGYTEVVGGKGANQAVAAATVGRVEFVGSVGDDDAAGAVLAELGSRGVGTSLVARVPGPTGRALITVTPDGENSILVAPLANSRLTDEHVERALDAAGAAVVLAQLEIPDPAVLAAWRWCAGHGARFILNPSPVRGVRTELLAACDPVIVNLGEARAILGTDGGDREGLAARLAGVARSAVVTLGADGALVAREDDLIHIPAPRVRARDTTGAGDAFAGALAGHLCAGGLLPTAAQAAAEHAARVVSQGREERVAGERC